MDAIRQLARRWEGWADSVETLLRERPERRAEIARLAGDLEESRTALERTRRELWTKTETLTRLETALAAADRDRQALQGALDELRGRHDALLKDRQFAIDHLEAALRRLTS
jgi:chromosome segregation ATPase